MAIGPGDRVGLAYFQADGGFDAGGQFIQSYDITYLEWASGAVATPQRVQTVQVLQGIALAFQSNGEPAVAYLGGPNKNASPYWFQQNATVDFRRGGSTWTEEVVDTMSADTPPPDMNPVDMSGFCVGAWPALAFDDAGTAYFAYRDIHNAQNQVDYSGSDLKIAIGAPSAWQREGVAFGGDNHSASLGGLGGHNQILLVNGEPSVISDRMPYQSQPVDVTLFRRTGPAVWSPAVGSAAEVISTGLTTSGPSAAYDAQAGLAVTWFDGQAVLFMQSADGVNWPTPTPLFQSGTISGFPSVAVDPQQHTPWVSFVFCSVRNGVALDACPQSEAGIRLVNVATNSIEAVAAGSAWYPRLGFLSTGKRVVAYQARDGSLALAVER
jgi:hypothetical protein